MPLAMTSRHRYAVKALWQIVLSCAKMPSKSVDYAKQGGWVESRRERKPPLGRDCRENQEKGRAICCHGWPLRFMACAACQPLLWSFGKGKRFLLLQLFLFLWL